MNPRAYDHGGSPSAIRETRLMFLGLCAYVLSQAFTIPIVGIGPWPLWPTLSDLALIGLLGLALFTSRTACRLPPLHSTILRCLVFIWLFCAATYVCGTVLFRNLGSVELAENQGVVFGAFGLFRLAEFVAVFWVVSMVPLSPERRETLGRIAVIVAILVCLGVIATYFDVVTTKAFGGHLPTGAGAGQWDGYRVKTENEGLGAVGYNHGYVSAQITMLLALCLSLRPRSSISADTLLLVLSLVAVLLTGSRAGLIGQFLFVIWFLAWRSWPWLGVLALLAALALVTSMVLVPSASQKSSSSGSAGDQPPGILERQSTVFAFYESDNLSDRDDIWRGKLARLNQSPLHWITGWGFGSAIDIGPGAAAHMLPLQFTVEMGLVGLTLISVLGVNLLLILWKREPGGRPVFWATMALLVGAASAETFYPDTSMGQFLGLYFLTISLTFRIAPAPAHEALQPVRFIRRPGLARLQPVQPFRGMGDAS